MNVGGAAVRLLPSAAPTQMTKPSPLGGVIPSLNGPQIANVAEVRRLEAELVKLTDKRHEQERKIRLTEKALATKSLSKRLAPKVVGATRVAPGLIVQQLEDRDLPEDFDEGSLYSLFLKHGQSLTQQKSVFQSAERFAEDGKADEAEMKLRSGLRGPKIEGGLDKWELTALLMEIGLVADIRVGQDMERAMKTWMRELDVDGNGLIEWSEMRSWFNKCGGRYKVRPRPLAEVAAERLSAESHWLPRQRRTGRPPPALPVVDGAQSEYAMTGRRPRSSPPLKTTPRAPRSARSTAADRRLSTTRKYHKGGAAPASARPTFGAGKVALAPMRPAPILIPSPELGGDEATGEATGDAEEVQSPDEEEEEYTSPAWATPTPAPAPAPAPAPEPMSLLDRILAESAAAAAAPSAAHYSSLHSRSGSSASLSAEGRTPSWRSASSCSRAVSSAFTPLKSPRAPSTRGSSPRGARGASQPVSSSRSTPREASFAAAPAVPGPDDW